MESSAHKSRKRLRRPCPLASPFQHSASGADQEGFCRGLKFGVWVRGPGLSCRWFCTFHCMPGTPCPISPRHIPECADQTRSRLLEDERAQHRPCVNTRANIYRAFAFPKRSPAAPNPLNPEPYSSLPSLKKTHPKNSKKISKRRNKAIQNAQHMRTYI